MNTHGVALRRLGRVLALPLLLNLGGPAPASAQFIPYYGKNKVKYDNFAWRVYKSPHFEVFYYPEFEQHLARLVSYLESAYLKLATGLKHEISSPIPAILYKTHSEFEQTNLFNDFVPEGVLAFAEPLRGRLVLPIDEPPDRLQGLIQHELTHIFEFDLIPRFMGYGLAQRQIPLWIDEGLADYFRGIWDPLDLMQVRDAAVTEQVPKLSRAEFEAFSGRLVYNMGHACFEFMEARYGKEGIRQFLYTLRKGILGGSTEDIYKQAFRTTPRKGPLPQQGQDSLYPGLRFRPQPLGGDRGRRDRQPLGGRGGRGAPLRPGRDGVPEPDPGTLRVREHHLQRRLRGRAHDELRPQG